jgi:hypothetical protein
LDTETELPPELEPPPEPVEPLLDAPGEPELTAGGGPDPPPLDGTDDPAGALDVPARAE